MRAQKLGGVNLSPRTGRPRTENPKEQRFTIRLDNVMGSRLDKYCHSVGKNRAEVIREAIEYFLSKK